MLGISFLIFLNGFSQTKCKFVAYSYSEHEDYGKVTYCGSYHHRKLVYGTRKTETACFLNLKTKKMFYVTRVSSCYNYCNLSSQYFSVDWVHKGFRSDWREGVIYTLKLKETEFSY